MRRTSQTPAPTLSAATGIMAAAFPRFCAPSWPSAA